MSRVQKIGELQGWREAKGEELDVIQGYFLKDAKLDKQSEKIIDLVLAAFLCFVLWG